MQISSGTSPMAYVLSNYDAPSSSGEFLFKFNPMIFSSTPIWIKKQSILSILITAILGYSWGETKISYMLFHGLTAKVLSLCLILMEIQNGSMLLKMGIVIITTLFIINL